MIINLNGRQIEFQTLDINIVERNIEHIFKDNKKAVLYKLDKAIANPKDRLHQIAKEHKIKYEGLLNLKLGEFLLKLKSEKNEDYLKYLNKYGDKKYCIYKIEKHEKDKGIYCYIIENEIVYIGRSKKNFKERFNEYGKITAYNCLIDGQATNCNINSKINELSSVKVGFHIMTNDSDEKITLLEKELLKNVQNLKWNIQKK